MKLLTLKDVASALRVSVDTVARMCDHGMIEFIPVKTSPEAKNVRRRIPAAALERYIARNLVSTEQ